MRRLVGASGFEPEASCAQGSSPGFSKHSFSNRTIEKARLNRAACLCPGVPGCARLALGSLQKSLHCFSDKIEQETGSAELRRSEVCCAAH